MKTRADRIALVLSLLAVLAAYVVANRVFENMAHIEDEMAYLWQAQAIAGGHLTVPSPPEPHSFLVPFVVDYNGQRFGKYPPGWPALLAIGIRLNLRNFVNPLLAGLGVWLTYRLAKKLMGETVGVLAAVFTLASPFFLMNSASLLSHPMGLVLTLGFVIGYLDAFWNEDFPKPWLAVVTGAGCLGLLALSRPFTAVAVAAPFAIHALVVLVRGPAAVRWRMLAFGVIFAALAALLFVWQFAVTGNPLLNPYTLWWPYDQVGFGPGHGRIPGGHNLDLAYINTKFSFDLGKFDLFSGGVPFALFIIPGIWVIRRNLRAILVACLFPSLVLFYLAYWVGAWLYGPRYFYEGYISIALLCAAGVAWLADWPTRAGEPWHTYEGWKRLRPLAVTGLTALLIGINLTIYTPLRLGDMRGMYGVNRSALAPFETPQAQELTPALVIVDVDDWINYGTLLELADPYLKTPFIFVISRSPEADNNVAASFPERKLFYYYPEIDPYLFYTGPVF